MKNCQDLKVALVHDFLTAYGGAERVLEVLAEMYPEAPIYTILYDKEKMRGKFANREIHPSFFQKMPKFLRHRFKLFLPLLPVVPETFDLREFDLVISSSGAWSKGIITRLNTIHIAYIHSPMRYVWDYNEKYLKEERKERFGFFVRPVLSYFRLWDKLAADRPDYLIANSKYTQNRISKYYRRESAVIYPPVEVKSQIQNLNIQINHKFQAQNSKYEDDAKSYPPAGEAGKLKAKSYFLVVSRLSPYKKIDKIVEAFNKLKLPLKIVGEGKQEKYLQKIAGKNIEFLGWQSDAELQKIYAGARAFIFAGVDDFGMAPVEAMLSGVPVVAIRQGGIKEVVLEGQTGEFFDSDQPEIIADGVRRFRENEGKYDREVIKNRAREFGKERFVREINEFIKSIV